MKKNYIAVERLGHISVITINRPEVLNALHVPANLELSEAFDEFEGDPDQWVAIVTGAGGRAFCAGNDLKHQAAGGEVRKLETGFGGLTDRFTMNKPVIAAVNGIAMGGGFEIALACDIILVSENALFALPEPRVGLLAATGGMQRLPRAVGLQTAMSIILTGRKVDAADAFRMGLAAAVYSSDELLEAALRWAREICEASPLAVQAAKETTLQSLQEPDLRSAMQNCWSYPSFTRLMNSEDAIEGPRAFSEKRRPVWTGRELPPGERFSPLGKPQ